MGLSIDDHTGPTVTDDGDMSALDPGVGVDEMVGELGGEQLEGIDVTDGEIIDMVDLGEMNMEIKYLDSQRLTLH